MVKLTFFSNNSINDLDRYVCLSLACATCSSAKGLTRRQWNILSGNLQSGFLLSVAPKCGQGNHLGGKLGGSGESLQNIDRFNNWTKKDV